MSKKKPVKSKVKYTVLSWQMHPEERKKYDDLVKRWEVSLDEWVDAPIRLFRKKPSAPKKPEVPDYFWHDANLNQYKDLNQGLQEMARLGYEIDCVFNDHCIIFKCDL